MTLRIRRSWMVAGVALVVAGLALVFAQAVAASPIPDDEFLLNELGPMAPAAPDDAQLQIAHLAPFAADPGTVVTVTLNGTDVLTNVAFADSTGYLPVPAGSNQVQIFPGSASSPAISVTVFLTDAVDFTAVAVGGANGWPLDLKLLVDDNSAPTAGSAKVRIGHLAPFAAGAPNTLADVRLQDGTILTGFDDVPYDTIADYIELPAGTYDLKITNADGTVTLIDPLPATFNNGDILSVFAVGDGTNQPVGAFALPAGSPGTLLPLAASLQIAHLAPFAMDPNTVVTVTLNGSDVLTNVAFADSTGYLPVPAGPNQVQIFPGSNASPAISATVNLNHAADYTAIAVGGVNGWSLDLKLETDDNTAPAPGFAKVRIGHLAPFAAGAPNTLADVRQQDGTIILNDVPYDTIGGYLPLPAGTYDLMITNADGSVVLIDPIPVTFNDGDILSAFAVGDGANQPVGLFALPAGAPGALVPLAPKLQLAHLAPFDMDPGTAVTVTINGTDVLTNVEFADSTGYLPAPVGSTQVQIFAGSSSTPAISETVVLTQDMKYTAVAIGGPNAWPLELKLLVDDDTPPDPGLVHVRIGHVAPFAAGPVATLADVRLQDGTIVANDVPYGLIAAFAPLPAGTADLKITSADGSVTLIDPLPVTLNPGDIVSLFAVGDGTNQPVGAFALPLGSPGGLLPLGASLQVAHLAPFAPDPGTVVTVTLNGTDVLTNVAFADSTGYLPVPAGANQVQIFPGSSPTPAISATVNLTHATDFTAIAVGGANSWPLGLRLLVDDNTPPTSGNAKIRIGHLAPFAAGAPNTLADVRLQDGTILTGFDDVPYDTIADYIELPEGPYDLKITNADGTAILIDPLTVAFGDGDILSVFAVGDVTNQPVGAFALPAGAPGTLLPLAEVTVYMPIITKAGP